MEHVRLGGVMQTMIRLLVLLTAAFIAISGAALSGIQIELQNVRSAESASSEPTESTDGDADSGQDAGDARSEALRLDAPGRYKAYFKDLDRDWYTHPSGGGSASCIEATASGDRLIISTFDLDTAAGPRSLTAQGGAVKFGLASVALEEVYFGFSTDGSKSGGQRYDFGSRVLATSDVTSDPGGMDAGGTLLGATVAPDGCFGGTLTASSGDEADIYSFQGASGDRVVFTFAHGSAEEPLELVLLRPDSTEAGRTASDGSIGLSLDTSGTWYLVVRAAQTGPSGASPSRGLLTPATLVESDTDYTIGGCKPFCEE